MKKLPVRFVIVRTLTNTLMLGALFYLVLVFGPMLKLEIAYRWREWRGVSYTVDPVDNANQQPSTDNQKSDVGLKMVASNTPVVENSYFSLKSTKPVPREIKVAPVSTDFGLVIEKIGVNVPVVANVDSADYEEYTQALRLGVAHAKGSSLPGEAGNVYIHGHASLGFWELGSYATVFTMLSKVERGDRVVVFYEGKRFDYEVFNKETFPGYDITPLAREFEESVLTIQTCDPPGTTLNRLIVTARLIS